MTPTGQKFGPLSGVSFGHRSSPAGVCSTLRATGGVMRAVGPARPAVAFPRILFGQAPGGENVDALLDAIPGGRGGPDASPPFLPRGLARGETCAPVRGFSAKGCVLEQRDGYSRDAQDGRLRDVRDGEPWMNEPDGRADLRWLIAAVVCGGLFWLGLIGWMVWA